MKRWWPILLRILIGGTFIWAGTVKVWDPSAFAQAVEGYRLLPHTGAVLVALYLPWLEIACGLTLLAGRLRSGSILVLAFLLIIFLSALISAWWRGLDISCGCFTSSSQATGYLWPISRNLFLLTGLVLSIFISDTNIAKAQDK